MNKNIGFRRNIYLSWMDAAAAFCAETPDPAELRVRLDPVVAQQIASPESRRMAIDVLVSIWSKSAAAHPALHDEALALFASASTVTDRLWLHYGMTLLTYDFFRLGVMTIGQLSRYQETITPKEIKQRLIADLGQMGSLDSAADRILFSLRNWGILVETDRRHVYRPLRGQFAASAPALEKWMLAAALTAHPASELPFADLVRLPELFPFRVTIGVDQLRQSPRLEVHRQGSGWDSVMLRRGPRPHPVNSATNTVRNDLNRDDVRDIVAIQL